LSHCWPQSLSEPNSDGRVGVNHRRPDERGIPLAAVNQGFPAEGLDEATIQDTAEWAQQFIDQRTCRGRSSATVDSSISVQHFDIRDGTPVPSVEQQQRDRVALGYPSLRLLPDLPSPSLPAQGGEGGRERCSTIVSVN
jgi:hypothetical protein